jgi:uncharacterized protein (DUF433 family)
MPMNDQELLARVIVDPQVCQGKPFIRGTRIYIAIILDALAQGLSTARIIEHYPCLEAEDIQAAVAFAMQLAERNGGVALVGADYSKNPLQPS